METKTIEKVTQTIIDYRGKTPPKSDSGIRLVTAKVVKDGFILDDRPEFISEETYKKWMKRGIPKQWDILITTEAPLGEVCQIRTSKKIALAQRLVLLRGNPKTINQNYFFYALKSPFVQNQLKERATGTTVLGIRKSELIKIEIPYYPLKCQELIAHVLRLFDDLIEINIGRIRILEEVAKSIYNGWFIQHRYPRYESENVKSPQGSVPKGWKVKKLKDFARIVRGKSYRSSNLVEEGGTPFVTLKCIDRDGGFRVDGLKHFAGEYKEKHVAKVGDIVIALTDMTQERRVIARAARVPDIGFEKFVFSMDLLKLVPLNVYDNEFLYGLCRYSQMPLKLKEFASGVNVLHLSQGHVKGYRFLAPQEWLRRKYSENVSPVFDQIDALTMENILLRKLRELLLPQLISGKIDVNKLDISGD